MVKGDPLQGIIGKTPNNATGRISGTREIQVKWLRASSVVPPPRFSRVAVGRALGTIFRRGTTPYWAWDPY